MEVYPKMKTNIFCVSGFLSSLFLVSVNLFADNAGTVRYTDKVIDRPSIMPVGIINFETGVQIKSDKPEDKELARSTNLSIAAQFGIVENVQGEVGYDGMFPFKPTATEHSANTLTLGTKYNYFSFPHISLSAGVKLPMHIHDKGEIVREVKIGLPSVFYNDIMAGSIFSNLLTINMRPNVGLELDFNFWYGLQIYGKLWGMVNSSFATVKMINVDNQAKWETEPFWKKLPADLSLTYVINHYIDVGANFGFGNALKAADTMNFGAQFSIRGGRIFG